MNRLRSTPSSCARKFAAPFPGAVAKLKDLMLLTNSTRGGAAEPGQILVGFAAETDDLLQNAQGKLERKNLDYIAANIVGVPGRGFGADNNAITLLGRNGSRTEFALQSKEALAESLLKFVLENKG